MDIVIHAQAPEPVYEQIVRQIHQAVKSGTLEPRAPLPTVRQLASDLVINRNTVARAYRILEEQGVILTAGRKGTFIRHDAAREVAKVKATRAERVMRRVVKTLVGDGLSRKEIADVFATALSTEARKG
jgi:GntR family transcriptional regulator